MRTTIHKLKSYAKINLGLNIISKNKSNNLHNIESLVALIDLADEIQINEINSNKHKVLFIGKFSKAIPKINTVSKLLILLDKKRLLKKKYKFIIKKNIPQKSGMGGGSMNAATILNFFKKKKILTKNQAENFAKKIGSDVILGLSKQPKVYNTNGKIIEIKNKIKYNLLLVKPRFGCSTKKVFSANSVFSKKEYSNINRNINKKLILKSKNDLEYAAIKLYPKLKWLKNELLDWKTAEFVRMTGSGSTFVMYFNSNLSAKCALKFLKRKLNNYWCILSKVI